MPNFAVWIVLCPRPIASIVALVLLVGVPSPILFNGTLKFVVWILRPRPINFQLCTLVAFRRPKGKRIFTCAVPAVASQCQLMGTLMFDRVAQENCSFQVVWISYPLSPIGYKRFS